MLDVHLLAKIAAGLNKPGMKTQRGRAGRNARGDQMTKQLYAAGKSKMDTPGVIAYPKGRSI